MLQIYCTKIERAMSNISLFLDTRHLNKSGEGKFRILVSHNGSNAIISLSVGCKPSEWDGVKVVKRHDRSALNAYIQNKLYEARNAMMTVSSEGVMRSITAIQLRDRIMEILDPKPKAVNLIEPYFLELIKSKNKSRSVVFRAVLNSVRKFDDSFSTKSFEDVDRRYVKSFASYLLTVVSRNSAQQYLRTFATVFNAAIEDELTKSYPFKGVQIKNAPTAKRNLSAAQMRAIIDLHLEGRDAFGRDVFVLSFLLIGMNTIDMFDAKPVTPTGRVDYIRAKTGKPYSIKVFPEAQEIIDRYKSDDKLFASGTTSFDSFRFSLLTSLKRIGAMVGVPSLTSYYARHTWASLASELDVPFDTIARALGHGGYSVTDIYIAYDYRKVDEANRKVIDYVFRR